MLTLIVLIFFVIIFFGLLWHDEPSGPAADRSTKTSKTANDRQNQRNHIEREA
jgi:hypothetical protein